MALLVWLVLGATAEAHQPLNVRAGAESTRDYWTPKRLASAEPVPVASAPGGGALAAPRSAEAVGRPGQRPGTAPAGIAGAPQLNRLFSGEVADQTLYPQSANGKLFFSSGRSDYECSASVVQSQSNSVILTAGHCIFGRRGGFSKRLLFVPAYVDGAQPYGSWTWDFEVVSKQYFKSESLHFDYGAVKLRPNASGSIGDVVGELGLRWNQSRDQLYRAIGYPSNLAGGGRMWNCVSGLATVDKKLAVGPPPSGIECDMGGGSSGGGWTIADSTGFYLNSVTSYSLRGLSNVLFGPYLTGKVNGIVNRANRG